MPTLSLSQSSWSGTSGACLGLGSDRIAGPSPGSGQPSSLAVGEWSDWLAWGYQVMLRSIDTLSAASAPQYSWVHYSKCQLRSGSPRREEYSAVDSIATSSVQTNAVTSSSRGTPPSDSAGRLPGSGHADESNCDGYLVSRAACLILRPDGPACTRCALLHTCSFLGCPGGHL